MKSRACVKKSRYAGKPYGEFNEFNNIEDFFAFLLKKLTIHNWAQHREHLGTAGEIWIKIKWQFPIFFRDRNKEKGMQKTIVVNSLL